MGSYWQQGVRHSIHTCSPRTLQTDCVSGNCVPRGTFRSKSSKPENTTPWGSYQFLLKQKLERWAAEIVSKDVVFGSHTDHLSSKGRVFWIPYHHPFRIKEISLHHHEHRLFIYAYVCIHPMHNIHLDTDQTVAQNMQADARALSSGLNRGRSS